MSESNFNDDDGRKMPSYEQTRLKFVENVAGEWWRDVDLSKLKYSEYYLALDRFTRDATCYAENMGISNARYDKYVHSEYDDFLDQAFYFFSNLGYGLGACTEENTEMRYWRHQHSPIGDLKVKKKPALSRPDLEAAVGEYLGLPYRSKFIDRLLVDVLVATELYSFGDEMLNPLQIPGVTQTPTLKLSPTLNWFVGNLITVGLWGIITTIFWVLSLIHVFPGSWLLGLNLGLGALFVLNACWTSFWLPFSWVAVSNAKKNIVKLINQMNGVYSELQSEGPISARHIEYRARAAADAGVVWPAPLFVLLDDINKRDGTL